MSSTGDRLDLANEYDRLMDDGTFEEHRITKLLLEAALKEIESRDLMLEAEKIRREFVEGKLEALEEQVKDDEDYENDLVHIHSAYHRLSTALNGFLQRDGDTILPNATPILEVGVDERRRRIQALAEQYDEIKAQLHERCNPSTEVEVDGEQES